MLLFLCKEMTVSIIWRQGITGPPVGCSTWDGEAEAKAGQQCAHLCPLSCLCPFHLHCQPLPCGSSALVLCQARGKMEDAAAIWFIFLWFPNVETPTGKLETGGKLKCLFTKAQTEGSRWFYPRNSSQELSQRNINKCRSQLNSPLTGTLALI